MKEFTCTRCGETFELIDSWDAEKEYDEIWRKNSPTHGRSVICDDCFKEFCVWALKTPELFTAEQVAYFETYTKAGD